MRPFLRWAGGKRWLTRRNFVGLTNDVRIVEPFAGGAAVFFSRNNKDALIADLNKFLINAYLCMKYRHDEIFELIQLHFDSHSKDHYYEVRARMGCISVQDAADFIYLNRSCFNGLFRVNLSGKFNVPIGDKVYELRDKREFDGWSRKLQSAEIKISDFEDTISVCGDGDFIFADPPYTVNHNCNGFIEYNENIFSWNDQLRLRESLIKAHNRGAKFALTNADHKSIRELYHGCKFEIVERGSEMAAKKVARGRTTEIIVTSF